MNEVGGRKGAGGGVNLISFQGKFHFFPFSILTPSLKLVGRSLNYTFSRILIKKSAEQSIIIPDLSLFQI